MEHETEEGKALFFEDQMIFFYGLLSAENIISIASAITYSNIWRVPDATKEECSRSMT